MKKKLILLVTTVLTLLFATPVLASGYMNTPEECAMDGNHKANYEYPFQSEADPSDPSKQVCIYCGSEYIPSGWSLYWDYKYWWEFNNFIGLPEGVSWDESTHTLTLDNFNYVTADFPHYLTMGQEYNFGDRILEDYTVVLKGDNHIYGLYGGEANIKVTGDGNLICDGNFTVDKGASLVFDTTGRISIGTSAEPCSILCGRIEINGGTFDIKGYVDPRMNLVFKNAKIDVSEYIGRHDAFPVSITGCQVKTPYLMTTSDITIKNSTVTTGYRLTDDVGYGLDTWGKLSVINSTLIAKGPGGGIWNYGTTTFNNSTVELENTTTKDTGNCLYNDQELVYKYPVCYRLTQSKNTYGMYSYYKIKPADTHNYVYNISGTKGTCKYCKKTTTAVSYNLTLGASAMVYSGNALKPSVKLTKNGTVLTKGKDYTVTYSNNKLVGLAKVTVKGIGQYSGTRTKTFKINPQATTIKSIQPGTKSFTVKWTKKTSQVTGYQVRYSLNKNMSSSKTVTVTKNTTVSKKVGNLKSRKNYYVQVRTYKTAGSVKYYSKWSKYTSVKTK